MIYTELTKMAMKLCVQAHAGQVDKSGLPYVLHPVHLAETMDDEASTAAALLHDVVEDTDFTFSDLEELGFPGDVVDALRLLTHEEKSPYMDYVRNLAKNPIARKVKMADLRHNLDKTRLNGEPDKKAIARIEKYTAALEFLDSYGSRSCRRKAICWSPKNKEEASRLEHMKNEKYRDQIRGSLIGGAAGDALGYEVEFVPGEWILRQFGEGGIRRYVKHGGLAQVSDDTQMTMYTAVGLLHGDTMEKLSGEPAHLENAIYLAYLDWLETQGGRKNKYRISWLNNLGDLYARRAPGNTCLSALRSGEMGSVAEPINESKGCGGVMRVAPIGLFFKNDGGEDQIRRIMGLGGEAAAITHGHPLGYISAAALVHIINRIVYGGCTVGGERSHWPSSILSECKELLVELYGDNRYTRRMNELIDLAAELAQNDRPDMENIHAIGGGWVGEEALAIAVYCWLRYPTDFDRALIASVNHSGDSDSTGAILGNIMGAAVGWDAIGGKWKEGLEFAQVLLTLADDLCDGCRPDSGADETWLDKYQHHSHVPSVIHG